MQYRFRSLASAASRPVLMIVTGAGASHDSIATIADSNYQPPLTAQLFAEPEYLRKYLTGRGSAKGLVADITSQLSRQSNASAALSVEEALTREYEASKGNDSLQRGFTAMRFYLRDLFRDATKEWPVQVGGATNYTWLVRNIEKWRSRANGYVLWVTFNYDGLVDQALSDFYNSDFGLGAETDPQLTAFLEDPDWALIKLHGSYDWRRRTPIPLPMDRGTGDAAATYAVLEAEWDAAADTPTLRTVYERALNGRWDTDARGDKSLWVPALMAPLADKASFECPPTHVEFLQAMLPHVDLIYTIGWRAQERHFLSMLASTRSVPPDILAVAKKPASSAEVAERIQSATRQAELNGEAQRAVGDPRAGFSSLRAETDDFPSEVSELIDAARARRTATTS